MSEITFERLEAVHNDQNYSRTDIIAEAWRATAWDVIGNTIDFRPIDYGVRVTVALPVDLLRAALETHDTLRAAVAAQTCPRCGHPTHPDSPSCLIAEDRRSDAREAMADVVEQAAAMDGEL